MFFCNYSCGKQSVPGVLASIHSQGQSRASHLLPQHYHTRDECFGYKPYPSNSNAYFQMDHMEVTGIWDCRVLEMWESALTLSWTLSISTSFQLHIWMSHVGGLELPKVGVLIPRKLADMASEGFFTGELAIINTQLALGESNIRRCELGGFTLLWADFWRTKESASSLSWVVLLMKNLQYFKITMI